MTTNKVSPFLLLLLGTASFVIVIAGMQAAASILNSFFLALIITIAVTPFSHWLVQKRLPRWLALLITILAVIIGGLILIAFLGLSISQLIHILPSYEPKIAAFKEAFSNFLAAKGINVSQSLSSDAFNPAKLIRVTANFLAGVAQALSASLLLIFVVAFMLIEANGFPVKLRQGLTSDSTLIAQFNEYNSKIRSYVLITAWTGAFTAFLDFLILRFLDIDLAALWGLLFFLLNFIPAVGFLLAIIPPVLLALLQFGGQKALLVFFFCWLIDNIMDKGIKPRYMQQGLDLSPLVIILSVIFWSWVLGPTGAILAVPLTLMIKKLVLESFEETRFLASLMGGGENKKVPRGSPLEDETLFN
jgi:predicted PurR-regulated permease PerM